MLAFEKRMNKREQMFFNIVSNVDTARKLAKIDYSMSSRYWDAAQVESYLLRKK